MISCVLCDGRLLPSQLPRLRWRSRLRLRPRPRPRPPLSLPLCRWRRPLLAVDVAISEGNAWDIEGASWAVNGGIFGRIGDGELYINMWFYLSCFVWSSDHVRSVPVTWAREAEVKHARICMLAALGSIVQDVYHFPFFDKWYNGEKVWGLHDAAIKSGALWQVWFDVCGTTVTMH